MKALNTRDYTYNALRAMATAQGFKSKGSPTRADLEAFFAQSSKAKRAYRSATRIAVAQRRDATTELVRDALRRLSGADGLTASQVFRLVEDKAADVRWCDVAQACKTVAAIRVGGTRKRERFIGALPKAS